VLVTAFVLAMVIVEKLQAWWRPPPRRPWPRNSLAAPSALR